MREEEQSGRVRKKQTFCCYKLDIDEDQQKDQPRNFLEKMPMVGRGLNSAIKFKNVQQNNRQPIYELLHDLYDQTNTPHNIYSLLAKKRINPVIHGGQERDDLQYYIPQIITYMVIEKNMEDEELTSLLLKGCSTDFYFAHRVYFYLQSLSKDNQGERIASIYQFLDEKFYFQMKMYKNVRLSGVEFTKSMIQMDHELKAKTFFEKHEHNQNSLNNQPQEKEHSIWKDYGTRKYPFPSPLNPTPIEKINKKPYCNDGFMETPKLWDDLLNIGNEVCRVPLDQRNNRLSELIMKINETLPANVYIPFFKEEIRLFTILCIWKGRLFSTNERAPFSIWIEIFREEEEQLDLEKVQELDSEEEIIRSPKKNKKNIFQKIYQTISKPFSISGDKNTLNLKKFLTQKISSDDSVGEKQSKKSRSNISAVSRSFAGDLRGRQLSISDVYENQIRESISKSDGRRSLDMQSLGSNISENPALQDEINTEEVLSEYFGPKSSDYIEEVKQKSIYRKLKSWKLVHLMIKTGDDIKQEQFAMQLINRFQYAFEKEKVDCVVFPYEVISLGPDSGIIEMLNDITTFSSLFEKLYKRQMTLRQFFDKVYPDPIKARKNFMRSLAGYSILTYFLQVKDRHNGNILLSRDGHIIHIDFGFFLSSAPGRGVELEKGCPFKLLTQYVEVIGQLNSAQFFEFRQLFYKGFRAVLKEKDAILTLVKMMYSSHMESMKCFIRGESAIVDLQNRFSIEAGVESFCYNLINSSLDNWRARWYDKFQYFLQKIYY